MFLRRIALFAGAVAIIVGIVGLLVPVSVSDERHSVRDVGCGSAIAPDLSAARAHDDGRPANTRSGDGLVADTNVTRLCRMELDDRRLWTITLAAAGAAVVIGALAVGMRASRTRSARP